MSKNSLLFDAATVAKKPAWLQRQLGPFLAPQNDGNEPTPTAPPPKRRKPAKRSGTDQDRGLVPDAIPERDQASALGAAMEGKGSGVPRFAVRFVGYRVRPLDPDNFAGSTKDLLDGLRHAGLIPGDEPWTIRLETEQVRVRSFAQECTVVTITPLHP